MLPAQLAFAVQPVVEEVGTGDDDLQRLQGKVVLPLRLVVGVDLLQRVVQHPGKPLHVVRHLGKLYQPLVAALGVPVHEDGGGGVVRHLRARFGTRPRKPALGIVHYQLLAEGIDEVLGASGNDELVGVLRGELHGVAYHVAPQAGRGGDNHRIVLPQFHFLQAAGVRMLLAHLLQRDELVEDAIVYHQQHGRVGRVVLRAEVSFGSVVGLHVVHPAAADDLLVLLAVGGERHAAVEEDFQVGPYLLQTLLARLLQEVPDEHQHPRRHAGEVGDIGMKGFAGDGFYLWLEVLHQGGLLARHTDEVHQRVDVLYQNGREVAHQAVVGIQVGRMAASQD